MRKKFTLTTEQFNEILEACKPTPVMYLSGGLPMYDSPQENANRAWCKFGDVLGFDGMSVKPVSGEPQSFTATIAEPKP